MPVVNFVVALRCEAAPLVARYQLEPARRGKGWRIYSNEHYRLIVSGVGKIAAAAATGLLQGLDPAGSAACWINVGLAGHGGLGVGEVIVADEIKDAASEKIWHPRVPDACRCPTCPVLTVDTPQQRYEPPWAVEMEAAGFFATATRTGDAARVGCLKVISDNPQHPPQQVTPTVATRLIADKLDVVDQLVEQLQLAPGASSD